MLKLKVAALAAAALALTACGTASPATQLAGQLTTTSSDSTTAEPTTTATTDPTTTEPTPTGSATTEPATSTKMPGKATVDHERIALGRVGGGQVTKVEREFEHGRTEWKYRILHNGRTYEVRVDAASGRITRFETKK